MAWLALDRAPRIASTRRSPGSQLARWHAEREAIAAEVTSAGFNPERGSYTRSYGSNDLDAAVLVLPLLDLANPLGLLPEEINPRGHRYLGNYPQALTHAALIQAALAIRDAYPD
jgi:GH15 family glucan-1,4-alpha-glucosidase